MRSLQERRAEERTEEEMEGQKMKEREENKLNPTKPS